MNSLAAAVPKEKIKKAALVSLKSNLKVSLIPSVPALDCQNLCHEYCDLMDNRSAYLSKRAPFLGRNIFHLSIDSYLRDFLS